METPKRANFFGLDIEEKNSGIEINMKIDDNELNILSEMLIDCEATFNTLKNIESKSEHPNLVALKKYEMMVSNLRYFINKFGRLLFTITNNDNITVQ